MKALNVAVLLAAAWALALPTLVSAQSYPYKSARVMVPFSPGAATDIQARILCREIVSTINAAIRKAMDTKTVRALFEQDALISAGGTPEDLGAHLKREIDRYAEVIRKGNITAQ